MPKSARAPVAVPRPPETAECPLTMAAVPRGQRARLQTRMMLRLTQRLTAQVETRSITEGRSRNNMIERLLIYALDNMPTERAAG